MLEIKNHTVKMMLQTKSCVEYYMLCTKSCDENKKFIFGVDGTPYERACSGNEIDSDLSEQLVTRLFQTRPQNSIWRLTRSGSYTLLLFLLYSSKYFCCYNQEMTGNTLYLNPIPFLTLTSNPRSLTPKTIKCTKT